MSHSILIKLKAFRPLLEAIQPLNAEEAEELRSLMRSLLKQPTDNVMSVTDFVTFARPIEILAQRRSSDQLRQVKEAIQKILYEC